MKRIIFPLVITLASVLWSCQPQSKWMTGTVEGVQDGFVYLQRFDDKTFRVIDSARIENGAFAFSDKGLTLPEIYGLTVNPAKGSFMIFLDKQQVTVALNPAKSYSGSSVIGSTLQDEYMSFMQQPAEDITEYIKAHPKSLVAAYVFYRLYSYQMEPDEIRSTIKLFDPSLANTQYLTVANALADKMESLSVGHKAPDFTADTPDGKSVSMSSYLGKGYLLIDFWAAWCGPCRRESPNLVSTYKKYKDKGFEILGVSLDDTKEDWVEAIRKDALDWPHVSDLKYWDSAPARLYAVRAIPANVLVDKDGVIVAKNLRGEALGEKLAELFQN